jgi:hypothetical protein
MLQPIRKRLHDLEEENKRLRGELDKTRTDRAKTAQ